MQWSKHGRQGMGSILTTLCPWPQGPNRSILVGPKIATTLQPLAAARCMTPESQQRRTSATAIKPLRSARLLRQIIPGLILAELPDQDGALLREGVRVARLVPIHGDTLLAGLDQGQELTTFQIERVEAVVGPVASRVRGLGADGGRVGDSRAVRGKPHALRHAIGEDLLYRTVANGDERSDLFVRA